MRGGCQRSAVFSEDEGLEERTGRVRRVGHRTFERSRHEAAAATGVRTRHQPPRLKTTRPYRAADLSLGEVESAASSARMFANLVAEKKPRAFEARKQREAEKDR